MGRHTTVLIVGALLLGGCAPSSVPSSPRLRMLFDEDGREILLPVSEYCWRIQRGGRIARAELEASAVKILEGRGWYSRLVAARALLKLSTMPEGRIMSPKTVRALVKNCVSISPWMPDPFTKKNFEAIRESNTSYARKIQTRLYIEWYAEVAGEYYKLGDGLPDEWYAHNTEVLVDGVKVAGRKGRDEDGMPIECVALADVIPPSKLYGKHTVVARVTLIAPNGCEIPVEEARSFTVESEREGVLLPHLGYVRTPKPENLRREVGTPITHGKL